jgi:hypothetical protein
LGDGLKDGKMRPQRPPAQVPCCPKTVLESVGGRRTTTDHAASKAQQHWPDLTIRSTPHATEEGERDRILGERMSEFPADFCSLSVTPSLPSLPLPPGTLCVCTQTDMSSEDEPMQPTGEVSCQVSAPVLIIVIHACVRRCVHSPSSHTRMRVHTHTTPCVLPLHAPNCTPGRTQARCRRPARIVGGARARRTAQHVARAPPPPGAQPRPRECVRVTAHAHTPRVVGGAPPPPCVPAPSSCTHATS